MERLMVLDTNAIILYANRRLISEHQDKIRAYIREDMVIISIITKLETLIGLHKEEHPFLIKEFLESTRVIGLIPEIEDPTVSIRRGRGLKLPDSIIAATALFYDAVLTTGDLRGFGRVKGLNLWIPERR